MPCRVAPPQGECGEGEEEAEICSSEEQEKRKRRREKKRTIKKEQREKRMGCRRGYMHCVQCGEQASTHMFVPSLLNDATLLRPRTAQTSYVLKSKGVLPPATFQPPASGGGRRWRRGVGLRRVLGSTEGMQNAKQSNARRRLHVRRLVAAGAVAFQHSCSHSHSPSHQHCNLHSHWHSQSQSHDH